MNFFKNFFTGSKESNSTVVSSEHAVIIHLKLSNDEFGTDDERDSIHLLSDEIEKAINDKEIGEFDGDEFGGGECTLYTYGKNADDLYSSFEKILKKSPLSKGGYVIKRYGESDEDCKEEKIDL